MSRSAPAVTPDSLTEDDLRLVHALQIAPRSSWVLLGEILGAHPATLAQRWERLHSSGLAWVTANELAVTRSSCLAFIEVECDLAERDSVIETLCDFPEVLSLDVSARSRDLLLTIAGGSVFELTTQILPRVGRVTGVRRYQISIATRIWLSGESWRLSALTTKERRALETENAKAPRDDAARPSPEIRRALAQNGRVTAAEIARGSGLHPATAQRRLARAARSTALRWRCEVAQEATGFPVTAEWFARLAPDQHEAAAAKLAEIPNMRLCASTTGPSNFLLTMWLSSVDEVFTMEQEILKKVPHIDLQESAIALSIVKRMGWILRSDGTTTGRVVLPTG